MPAFAEAMAGKMWSIFKCGQFVPVVAVAMTGENGINFFNVVNVGEKRVWVSFV